MDSAGTYEREPGSVPPAPAVPIAQPGPPYATWLLLSTIVLVWAYTETHGGSTNLDTLLRLGAQVNGLIWQGQWWRLVTPLFLHYGLIHLAFNGWALWILGRETEALFARARYLVLYFAAGIGGSLAELLFDPRPALTVGASGAIFGLLGALLYAASLFPRQLRGRYARGVLVPIVANLAYGLFLGSAINNYAHVGGLVAGGALAVAIGVPGEPARRGAWRVAGAVLLLMLALLASHRWPGR